MSSFLSKEQILQAADIATEEVEVPEWGGKVLVQGLTGSDRDAYEADMFQQRGKKTTLSLVNLRAKLVARAIINPETKERLFTDGEIVLLAQKSAAALERVFDVARKLSGMTDEDMEELEGNSKREGSANSGSPSH